MVKIYREIDPGTCTTEHRSLTTQGLEILCMQKKILEMKREEEGK